MNPAHTSPEPGLAPCGMKLEPVYADEVGEYPDSSLAPGTVRVTPRKQQLIGVRLAPVEKAPFTYSLRALGRVAVDERLIYRLNASMEGWIREVGNNSTGSVVQKGETLAIFYSPEFLAAQQAYIYALSSLDRFQATGSETSTQIQITKANIQQYVDSLRNLGMSDQQIKEIEKTRQYTENIRMVAPATSFVLARNISTGQRFDKGTEWYRLADLSRVWVLVDLYENEADFIRPGERVPGQPPLPEKGGAGRGQRRPAPVRSYLPDPEGAPGGGEPRFRPAPGHVHGRGFSGDAARDHQRPGRCRLGLRPPENGLRGPGGRLF